jgi:diphthine synthase
LRHAYRFLIIIESRFTPQENFYGREVILADRELVESGAEVILADADKEDVAFLVVGDVFGYGKAWRPATAHAAGQLWA